jgi:hypothetical protein
MRTINCSLTVGSPRDRGCRAGWFTGSLTSKWLVLFSVALLAMVVTAVPASAQTCLLNEYNLTTKGKLQCTANDVSVAAVSNVRALDGSALTTCIEGSTFSFVADFNIVTTANATNSGGRDNIGLYFQTDPSKPDALTGSCDDNIIAPLHNCSTATGSLQCGSTGYKEFDPSPDTCGDTSSSVNGNITDTILVADFKCSNTNTVPCVSDPSKQCLVLPNCTSWQTSGSSTQCVATPPSYAYPFNASGQPEAIPGSPSKCNCATIALPIQPVNPKPLALKACNTPKTTGTASFTFDPNTPPGTASPTTCDADAEGVGTATYTVAIDNPNVSGSFGDIIVDQICDSAYGQVFPATGSCKAGTVGAITGTDCSALDIPLGQFKTCTFTAPSIGELNTVSNIVTVSGHSGVNTAVTFSTSTNQVTVKSTDAASTATVKKSYLATLAACATVTLQVEVDNTSGADEVETLSALNDSPDFGDITKDVSHGGTVLATTCSVPQTIAVNGNYTCHFNAQFCSGVDGNTCISHVDTITATLKSDETGDSTFNNASNTLTVKECLTPSSQ